IAGGAAAVVDDDRLPQHGGKRFVEDARDDVGAACGRIGNKEANRPAGVAVVFLRAERPGDTQRQQQQYGPSGEPRKALRLQRVAAVDRYLSRCRVGSASASRRNGSPSSRVTIISSTVVLPSSHWAWTA